MGVLDFRCDECGEDFLIAYSCKGRGVCPSCNTKRMAETATHLVDHLFPQVPVRQRVLTLPKRHIGEPDSAPEISPARGPPDFCLELDQSQAWSDDEVDPAPEFEYDQTVGW